jgi:hypothetical protein
MHLLLRWWHDTVVPALLDDERQTDKLPSGVGSRWTCTQRFVHKMRLGLAVLVLLGMAVWLPLDVWHWDGIVPGTKDPYMVEAKRVEDDQENIWKCYADSEAGTSDECVYSCPCKIDTSGFNLLQNLYANLQMAAAQDLAAFQQRNSHTTCECL